MTSSSGTGHVYHHAKFRWTENLTCRFIQLRKEHGKMFTGRKYSAQAGWEYILRQMREEFPTIMADVHYRVLKKKWSNLLQQYKELKNPVHGDKNKADDISWPFYAAIDEVLGNVSPSPPAMWRSPDDDDEDDEQLVNPQEFLCVSVGDHDDDDEEGSGSPVNPSENINEYNGVGGERVAGLPRLQPLGRGGGGGGRGGGGPVFDVERLPRTTRRSTTTSTTRTTSTAAATTTTTTTMNSSRKRNAPRDEADLLSRLPRTTELTIRPVVPALEPISVNGRELEIIKEEARRRQEDYYHHDNYDDYDDDDGQEEERPRKKYARGSSGGGEACVREDRLERLERRMAEFLEYTKKRDEENRSILLRMLEAIEDIRRAVS